MIDIVGTRKIWARRSTTIDNILKSKRFLHFDLLWRLGLNKLRIFIFETSTIDLMQLIKAELFVVDHDERFGIVITSGLPPPMKPSSSR